MDSILSRPRHDDYSDGTGPFPSEMLIPAGEEPLSIPSTPLPMSKRHQRVSTTLALITQNFMSSREPTFLSLLSQIQSRLAELHEGNDEEYRQQLSLLEDTRDKELLEVEAARGFALERIEREYQEEKRLAEKEYQVPPAFMYQCLQLAWKEKRKRRIISYVKWTINTSTI